MEYFVVKFSEIANGVVIRSMNTPNYKGEASSCTSYNNLGLKAGPSKFWTEIHWFKMVNQNYHVTQAPKSLNHSFPLSLTDVGYLTSAASVC